MGNRQKNKIVIFAGAAMLAGQICQVTDFRWDGVIVAVLFAIFASRIADWTAE